MGCVFLLDYGLSSRFKHIQEKGIEMERENNKG